MMIFERYVIYFNRVLFENFKRKMLQVRILIFKELYAPDLSFDQLVFVSAFVVLFQLFISI